LALKAARQLDAMAQSTGKSLFFAWCGVDPLLLIQKNMLKQITETYAFGRGI